MAAKEAKKQGATDEDLSMEEILQSIRRIIAEDGEEPKDAVTAEKANGQAAKPAEPTAPPGSEVLELTEMIKDDGTTVSLKPGEPAAAAAAAPPAGDILSTIDQALGADKPAAPAAPAAAAPAPPPPAAAPVAPSATIGDPSLISAETAAATAATLKRFQAAAEPPLPPLSTTPSPVFLSGKTVEEMVADMLRPMMKDWLDRNLPGIVERIVTIEVRKLTK